MTLVQDTRSLYITKQFKKIIAEPKNCMYITMQYIQYVLLVLAPNLLYTTSEPI